MEEETVVAVVGSRTFSDYSLLREALDKIQRCCVISRIVSGGAKGADSLGEKYAKENDIPVTIFRPQWMIDGKLDRGAGMKRNTDIINEATLVVAFWDGESKGTKDSIDKAKAAGKELKIIRFSS